VTSKPVAYEPDPAITEKWESGEYGRSEEHAGVVSDEESAALDESLGLQPISIRLQRSLITRLKIIAKYRGIGYQPLVRDLLNRFAVSELKDIIHELEKAQQKFSEEEDSVVSEFLRREQSRKRA
jgi:hypothetical protein